MSTPKQTKNALTLPTPTPSTPVLMQRKCACGGSAGMAGECEECQGKTLQRKTSHPAEQAEIPPIVNDVLRSPGQPLDSEVRTRFESKLGHEFSRVSIHPAPSSARYVAPSESAWEREADQASDRVIENSGPTASRDGYTGGADFSQVRIHSDSRAAESAQAVNAFAYTVGSHIVFGPQQYDPMSVSGKRLLGHELTHVLQQNSGIQHASPLQRKEKKPDVSILVEGECKNPKAIAMSAVHGARMVRTALDWFLYPGQQNEIILNAHLRAHFGSNSPEMRKAVHSRLVQVSALLERAQTGGVTFACVDATYGGCKKRVAEAAKGNYRIVLCPGWFEDFASNGVNYGAYSLIHECSHIAGAVEKDEVYQNKIYGELSAGGQCLQNRSVGADPLNNADNYAWLVSCLVLPSDAAVFPGLTIQIPDKPGKGQK